MLAYGNFGFQTFDPGQFGEIAHAGQAAAYPDQTRGLDPAEKIRDRAKISMD